MSDASSVKTSQAIAPERDVVKDIETLIMGKTAPKDRRVEWLLLYLAGCELRGLRLTREILREQLISEGITPRVVKYDPLEGLSIIPGTGASATADSRPLAASTLNPSHASDGVGDNEGGDSHKG